MQPPAFEWLNVLDWQGELINWFLLSNCSGALMAFELRGSTGGEGGKEALLAKSVQHLFHLQRWSGH